VPVDVDHYAVLGVSPDADDATIRQAWIRAARASHPDQRARVQGVAAEEADERIRQVNEAWRVLGDQALRRDHDRDRRREQAALQREWAAAQNTPPAYHLVDGGEPDGAEGFVVRSVGVATLMRTLPWLIAGGLGLGIFVFTAFAGGSADEGDGPVEAPECVRIRSDETVRPVPCTWDNDGVIDEFMSLDSTATCRHEYARPHEATVDNARLCLVPYDAYVG